MIGSSTSFSARWYSAAESMNCVSRNSRLPLRMRLRPSSCSQPHMPASTALETSTTLRTLAMRARSLKRLMERATIHTGVGGINGLRVIHLRSEVCWVKVLRGDTGWHGARKATRLRLWQAHRERDRVVFEVGFITGRGRHADGLLLDARLDRGLRR